jgi:hypothetical protein
MEHGHKEGKQMLRSVCHQVHYPRDILKRKTVRTLTTRYFAEKLSVSVRRQLNLVHKKTKQFAGVKASETSSAVRHAHAQRRGILKTIMTRKKVIMKKEPQTQYVLKT